MRRLGNSQGVAVGIVAGLVVSANPKRRSIRFVPASNQSVVVSEDPSVSLTSGFPVAQGTIGVQLDYEDFGELVCKPFFAISAQATTIGIVEGYDNE